MQAHTGQGLVHLQTSFPPPLLKQRPRLLPEKSSHVFSRYLKVKAGRVFRDQPTTTNGSGNTTGIVKF
jgi:hypothetical protein